MVVTLKNDVMTQQPISINGKIIDELSSFKLFGVILDKHFNFHALTASIIHRSHAKHTALLLLKRNGVSTAGLCPYCNY